MQENEKMGTKVWNLIERMVRAMFGFVFNLAGVEWEEEQWQNLFQFVRFGLVGVWNTVFSFVINLLCLKAFQGAGVLSQVVFETPLRVYAANVIAWLISVFVAYLLSNRFVFQMEEGQTRSFIKSLLKSYVSYGFTGLILNNVLAVLWVGVLGIPEEIAPLISLVIAIPINFLMNKLWAFKTENK